MDMDEDTVIRNFPVGVSDMANSVDDGADDALADFAEDVTALAVDAFQVGNDAMVSLVGNVDGNMVRVTVNIDYA